MPDVFTKAKRSEVMSRIRRAGLKAFEVKVVPAEAEVFNDVGDDAARHVACMPRKGDQAVRMKEVGVMPMAPGGAKQVPADFARASVKPAAIPGGVLAHRSGSQNKLVPKSRRDGAAGFQKGFKMRLGSLLEAESGFPTVASMRMAARQQRAFGNPHAVLVTTQLNLRKRNKHDPATVACCPGAVKAMFDV